MISTGLAATPQSGVAAQVTATPDLNPPASALHDCLQAEMPWQAPGSLTSEEYWQLTAYLVRANGIDPGPDPLDEQSGLKILMRPAQADAPEAVNLSPGFPWFWIAAGIILSLAGGVFLVKYIRVSFLQPQ